MSLSGYSGATYGIGHELRDLLRADTFALMLAGLSVASMRTLAEFRHVDAKLVQQVATLQPKPRSKLLAKLPLEKQFWAIAAAAQAAFEASAVLEAATVRLRPGGSYREMIWEVQEVLLAQYLSPDADWPFPTMSPFPHPDDVDEEDED